VRFCALPGPLALGVQFRHREFSQRGLVVFSGELCGSAARPWAAMSNLVESGPGGLPQDGPS
jgi:hypothetical protein